MIRSRFTALLLALAAVAWAPVTFAQSVAPTERPALQPVRVAQTVRADEWDSFQAAPTTGGQAGGGRSKKSPPQGRGGLIHVPGRTWRRRVKYKP